MSRVVTESYSFNTYGNGPTSTPAPTPTGTPTPQIPIAPTAADITLSGTPQTTSTAANVTVSVFGSSIASYKYSLVSQATACSAATFSSSWISTSQSIQESLGTDGVYKLCVIAKGENDAEMVASTAKEFVWTKDTTPPTASEIVLVGLPPALTIDSSIGVVVGGSDIASYKYSLMANQSTSCDAAVYSSSWTNVSNPIAESTGTDGPKRLCVLAKDTAGNEMWPNQNTPKQHDWTRDTAPPTATISNSPSGSSSATALNVTVSGGSVVDYKYAITSGHCHLATNYSTSWIPVTTHIIDTLGADGFYRLCVVGRTGSLAEQSINNASTATWTKTP